MIGFRTALILYAALIVFAFVTLKGVALYLALLIVALLAVKTIIHRARQNIE